MYKKLIAMSLSDSKKMIGISWNGVKFVHIPSTSEEGGYVGSPNIRDNQPHKVVIPGVSNRNSNLYVSETLITNLQWKMISKNSLFSGILPSNPSATSYNSVFEENNHPVVGVDWYQSLIYGLLFSLEAGDLSEKIHNQIWRRNSGFQIADKYLDMFVLENIDSNIIRLPWESEWEHAVRGPEDNALRKAEHWFDYKKKDEYIPLFSEKGEKHTKPVGLLKANGFGLIDMSGSVWQWQMDRFKRYRKGKIYDNPYELDSNVFRIIRGGSWHDDNINSLRSGYRKKYYPKFRSLEIGFRLARLI